MAHIVTAPLVIARGEDGKDVYLYAGVDVPSNIPAAEVKRLEAEGFIAKVDVGKSAADKG